MITLDDIDRRILRALQQDARLTTQELSARVGLTPSPCARRLRLLREAGVIAGFTVVLNDAALGQGVTVFVSVKLDRQVDEALHRFETAVAACPEVVDCWLMTGSRDYLLRVVVADLAEFESFLTGRLTRVAGVASIESAIPIRRVKAGVNRDV